MIGKLARVVLLGGGTVCLGAMAAPRAEIADWNGAPAILVDGKPIPPMQMMVGRLGFERSETDQKAYYRKLRTAGFRVFYVACATNWLRPGDPKSGALDGVAAAIRDVRLLREAVPDALVMLRLVVNPPAEWVAAHPEEQITFSDGSHLSVTLHTSVGSDKLDGMFSFASEAWREEGGRAIISFLRAFDVSSEAEAVIGVFLSAGGTEEWYYPRLHLHGDDARYGDFSKPFMREYRRILKDRYKTEDALRRAWRNPAASFDTLTVPTHAECGRIDGPLGTFRDADKHAHVSDYYDAWHEATARSIVHFARLLKAYAPHRLVGAFYGYHGCTDYYDSANCTGVPFIINSGVVDILSSPGLYDNREPGGIVAQREMQDSFRLHNMMFVGEDDARTHRVIPSAMRDRMGLKSVAESVETLKRDFARNICEDISGWWFDMQNGWYDDREILALLQRQQEIARDAYGGSRAKNNEIAIIYDTESIHLAPDHLNRVVLDYFRTSDLGRIGAPVDYYYHNDLSHPKMPDYRLYVMLNTYRLDDAEVAAVYAKAARNHATVLWLYAPGYVNPDGRQAMSAENISRTVGMNVVRADEPRLPHFTVKPSAGGLVARADAGRRYGVLGHEVHSTVWTEKRPHLEWPLYPSFFVDDPAAVVLGRFCNDGRVAMASVMTNGVTSVYCCAPVVGSDLLASVAAAAGCHLFLERDDVLYANERFVAVHSNGSGRRTIRFKRKCSPYEVYERRYYGHGIDCVDVDMRNGETRMFELETGEQGEFVDETDRWQSAIDRAGAAGGGRVVIPSGVHRVGGLVLRSNVELRLEKGAVLEGVVGLEHYPVLTLPYSEGTWSAVVMGVCVTNVAVSGEGEIFGNGRRWNPPKAARDAVGCTEGLRARGVFFADSKDVRLSGFTLRDAACWGIVFKRCEDVVARGIKIDSVVNVNNDGFDIEAKNVLIEDCDVNTGDDSFCVKSNDPTFVVENVTVRDCIARTHCSALKIGTASHGTIRKVCFERCRIEPAKRVYRDMAPMQADLSAPTPHVDGAPDYLVGPAIGAICVECVDGGIVEDIVYDDIVISGCKVPIFVRGGTRMRRACGIPPSNRRILRNITIRNIRGQAERPLTSTITGVAGCRPSNIRLEDVAIECVGEGDDTRPFSIPDKELAGEYPDADMFENLRLPAYGLFVDQADSVVLRNVTFGLRSGTRDSRPGVVKWCAK